MEREGGARYGTYSYTISATTTEYAASSLVLMQIASHLGHSPNWLHILSLVIARVRPATSRVSPQPDPHITTAPRPWNALPRMSMPGVPVHGSY